MRPRLREHALHPTPHEIFTWEQLRFFEFRMKLKSKNKCITGASQRVTAVLVHVVMHNSLILCMFGHQILFIYFFYPPPAIHVWHRSVFSLPGLRDSRTDVSEEKRDGSGNTWAAAVGEAGGGGLMLCFYPPTSLHPVHAPRLWNLCVLHPFCTSAAAPHDNPQKESHTHVHLHP